LILCPLEVAEIHHLLREMHQNLGAESGALIPQLSVYKDFMVIAGARISLALALH
jgi:hypothetical protein